MSILEDLKNTDDWSIRYGLWERLFVGDNLFKELSQLDSGRIEVAVATIEKINTDAQEGDKPPYWEWITALGLITCAQVAYLSEMTPGKLLQMLRKVNPQAQVPVKRYSNWQAFVRTSFYEFSWPKPLNAEWAWDAVATFGNIPRRVLQRVQMALLLLERNVGTTADLTLELIEEGRGILYPNPETMSFVLR